MVKALPSNAGDDRGLTPGGGAKIAHVSWPKTQNISSRSNTVTNSINTLKIFKKKKSNNKGTWVGKDAPVPTGCTLSM